MFSISMKRKISFLLVFCMVLMNAPSMDALAFGYQKPDAVKSGLELSVGDILVSKTPYNISNEFYFWSDDDVYHAEKTEYSKLSHDVLTVYNENVFGFDSADKVKDNKYILSHAEYLILEYNEVSDTRDGYEWVYHSQLNTSNGNREMAPYKGHRKYPYNYVDANKTDHEIQIDSKGMFAFSLKHSMSEDTNYIITAMVPEKTGIGDDGKIHYGYRIVLEPIPADVIVKPELRIGDRFDGGKTYAFLLMEDQQNELESELQSRLIESNSKKFNLGTVYGIGPTQSYNLYFGADTIQFSFDKAAPIDGKDAPLYTKHIFPDADTKISSHPGSNDTELFHSVKTGEEWYSNILSQIPDGALDNKSVISMITYVTFPEGGTYRYNNLTVKRSENSSSVYPIYEYTYNFVSANSAVLYRDYVTNDDIQKLSYSAGDKVEHYENDNYIGWFIYDDDGQGKHTNFRFEKEEDLVIEDGKTVILYGIPKTVDTSFADVEEAYQKSTNLDSVDRTDGYFVLDPEYNVAMDEIEDLTAFINSLKYSLSRDENGKYNSEDYPCVAYLPSGNINNLRNARTMEHIDISTFMAKYRDLKTIFFYPDRVRAICLRGDDGKLFDLSRYSEYPVYFSVNYHYAAGDEDMNFDYSYGTNAGNISYSVKVSESFIEDNPYLVRKQSGTVYIDSDDENFLNKAWPSNDFFIDIANEPRKVYIGIPDSEESTCTKVGTITYTVEKIKKQGVEPTNKPISNQRNTKTDTLFRNYFKFMNYYYARVNIYNPKPNSIEMG